MAGENVDHTLAKMPRIGSDRRRIGPRKRPKTVRACWNTLKGCFATRTHPNSRGVARRCYTGRPITLPHSLIYVVASSALWMHARRVSVLAA